MIKLVGYAKQDADKPWQKLQDIPLDLKPTTQVLLDIENLLKRQGYNYYLIKLKEVE